MFCLYAAEVTLELQPSTSQNDKIMGMFQPCLPKKAVLNLDVASKPNQSTGSVFLLEVLVFQIQGTLAQTLLTDFPYSEVQRRSQSFGF